MSVKSWLWRIAVLLNLLLSIPTFSQNSVSVQIEDYVVLKNGRRFDGTILRNLSQVDFEKIEFLRRGETEVYFPEDIQSFGFGTGELYRSITLKGLDSKQFVQILVEGSVYLARDKSGFLVGEEEDLQRLEEKSTDQVDNSSSTNSRNSPYILTLNSVLAGKCHKKINSLIRRTKLSKDELLWLFSKYYKCEGSEVVFHTQLQPAYKVSPVAMVSGFQTGIKTDQLTGDRKDAMSSSMIFQGHLGIKVHSIRTMPKVALEVGGAFETSTFTWESRLESGTGSFTASEEMSLSFLSFPINFEYTFAKSRTKDFFVGAGTGYGFSISKSSFAIQDILYRGYDYMLLEEGSFVDVKNGVVFFQGQAGMKFKLASEREIALFGKFRYMPSYYAVEISNNVARYHKIDLGLGLSILF